MATTLTLYQDVVSHLRSRRPPQLAKRTLRLESNREKMRHWLSMLGYKNTDELNVIHLTGTKGKGSTAAFTESLIRARFRRLGRPIKTGLYTSPHLVTERERIRVNFQLVSENAYVEAFHEIRDALMAQNVSEDELPAYLQFHALMSYHIFMKEKVDVAIYEVHSGGEKDATNIFDHPVACGFTMMGLDHTNILGNSIESITKQKSGIMKRGSPAFSTLQNESVAEQVLRSAAAELECPLEIVETNEQLPQIPNTRYEAQRQNASLAIKLANAYLGRFSECLTAEDIEAGLNQCSWPGRFQTIQRGSAQWFLDTAHNSMSIPIAMSLFNSETRQSNISLPLGVGAQKVLIFGHDSVRDPYELMTIISQFCIQHGLDFDLVIFSSYEYNGTKIHVSPTIEKNMEFWKSIQPSIRLARTSSPREAITLIENLCLSNPCQTLVTGSVDLVGGTLNLLQSEHAQGEVGCEVMARLPN